MMVSSTSTNLKCDRGKGKGTYQVWVYCIVCGTYVEEVKCVFGFVGNMTKSVFPETDKETLRPFSPHFLS